MIVAVVCSGCATAFTDRIDNVTGTTALVAGHAITNTGGQVEFWAQYRADLGVRLRDGAQHDLDDPNSSSQIWTEMSGLQRSTTYHFRMCAQDSQQSGGLGYGEDRTFTTTNLECGDVITHDFILSGSMTCLKSFATPGLVIGPTASTSTSTAPPSRASPDLLRLLDADGHRQHRRLRRRDDVDRRARRA